MYCLRSYNDFMPHAKRSIRFFTSKDDAFFALGPARTPDFVYKEGMGIQIMAIAGGSTGEILYSAPGKTEEEMAYFFDNGEWPKRGSK